MRTTSVWMKTKNFLPNFFKMYLFFLFRVKTVEFTSCCLLQIKILKTCKTVNWQTLHSVNSSASTSDSLILTEHFFHFWWSSRQTVSHSGEITSRWTDGSLHRKLIKNNSDNQSVTSKIFSSSISNQRVSCYSHHNNIFGCFGPDD